MKIRRFLGLSRPQDRMVEYNHLMSELNKVESEGKDLARQFSIQKSIMNAVNDNQVPTENIASVMKRHAEFMKSHTQKVSACVNRRNEILKSIQDLIEIDEEVNKAYTKASRIQKADCMYKEGKLSKSQYFDVLKAITGEPTKYADVIAMRPDGRFLILHRVDDDMCPTGKVCIPGGHVEPGEDFETAALREFKEETNLDPMVGRGVTYLGEYKNDSAHIKYYQVWVDAAQPVTVDCTEHCFSEWIELGDVPLRDFIFDQGENIISMMTHITRLDDIKPIQKALKEGKRTPEGFKAMCREIVKKALSIVEAAPLMPESLDGEPKKIAVPVRDPFCRIEHILKGISGSEAVTVNDNVEIRFARPLIISDVSYASDPHTNKITEAEITFVGEESDMMRILNEMKFSLMSGGVKFRTAQDEFVSVNERGTDYVGDPIFVTF